MFRFFTATITSFLLVLILAGGSAWIFESSRIQKRRLAIAELTNEVARDIRDNLHHSLSATYALAAVIRQSNGTISNFNQLAREMLAVYHGISCLQIAPNGVITQVVPLAGNEKAIGHNLLEDTHRNKEALLALRTRALTLAGPFDLIQGGKGTIGRLPVFLTNSSGTEYFWGFANALIRTDDFLAVAKIQRLSEKGCSYELYRVHPDTGAKDVFSSAGKPLRAPVSQVIQVPNGEWTLLVEPADGWYSLHAIVAEVLLVLLLSTVAALAVWWLTRQPMILQKMVDDRTADLTEANLRLHSEIAERKHAEDALKFSENKLRSIFSSLSDQILILDSDGRCLEIAPTGAKAVPPAPELLGKKVSEIFPSEQAELFLATIRQALASGTVVSVDYPLAGEDEEIWYAANVSPLSQTTVVWSAIDITQRKKAEEERLKLEMQILHGQKLESLGVLAGGIAHDFNNILTAITGNVDLALKRLGPESPIAECLQRAHKAAARAADLSRQMLAYSGKGRFVIEEIDLNHLVEELGHMLEVSISKKASLRYSLYQPLPTVTADATQIRQVVMNLVINAAEALGENSGIIAISTGCMECTEADLQALLPNEQLQPGRYVFIEVVDTGCGMSSEVISRLFDPFFSTKFTGRGLGMAAVLGIVRSHKGAIIVDSEAGKGSSFRIILPVSTKAAVSCTMPENVDGNWKGDGGVVLLVEDEEIIRKVGTEMLNELGYEVITAEDGQQALDLYTSRDDIRLVLLDLTMPKMDGEQCFRELRRIDPTIRIIMCSGFDGQEVMQKLVDQECSTTFIQKPYSLSDLRTALQRQEKNSGA